MNLRKELQVDISRGEEQCDYVEPNSHEWGYLCCTYRKGHDGDHHTCYEIQEEGRKWITREEYYECFGDRSQHD